MRYWIDYIVYRIYWWAQGTTKWKSPDKIIYPTYFTIDKSIYTKIKCKNIDEFLVKHRYFVEKGVGLYVNNFVCIDVNRWRIWHDGCAKRTLIQGDIDEMINYFNRL